MKKKICYLSIIVLIISTVIISGCRKRDVPTPIPPPPPAAADTTKPVITLNGDNPMTVSLGGAYIEPGATAMDNRDGDISSKIITYSSVIPTNATGTYTISYTVKDTAGNKDSVTRTVQVRNDAEFLAGSYSNAIDTDDVGHVTMFNATLSCAPFSYVNYQLEITNFAAFGFSVQIHGTLNFSKTSIDFPGQTISGNNTLIFGTGTIVRNDSVTIFKVHYKWMDQTSTHICNSWYYK